MQSYRQENRNGQRQTSYAGGIRSGSVGTVVYDTSRISANADHALHSQTRIPGIHASARLQGRSAARLDERVGTPTQPWCDTAYTASLDCRVDSLPNTWRKVDTGDGGSRPDRAHRHSGCTGIRPALVPSCAALASSARDCRYFRLSKSDLVLRACIQMCAAMPSDMTRCRSFSLGSCSAGWRARHRMIRTRRLLGCTEGDSRRESGSIANAHCIGDYRTPARIALGDLREPDAVLRSTSSWLRSFGSCSNYTAPMHYRERLVTDG